MYSWVLKKGTGTSRQPLFRAKQLVGLGASPLFQRADGPVLPGAGYFSPRLAASFLLSALILAIASCSSRSPQSDATGASAGDATATQSAQPSAAAQQAAGKAPSEKAASRNSQPRASSIIGQFTFPELTPARWHDILPLIDLKQDATLGQWKLENRELVGKPDAASDKSFAMPVATLSLPAAPQGQYHLRVQLQLDAAPLVAAIVLPVGSRQVVFAIDATGHSASGFELIDGQKVDDNATRTSGVAPDLGQPYQLDLLVLPKGDQAELYAMWDSVPVTYWKGPLTALSTADEYARPGPPTVRFISQSPLHLYAVHLGPISGNFRYSRDAAKLAQATSQQPLVNPQAAAPAAPAASSSAAPASPPVAAVATKAPTAAAVATTTPSAPSPPPKATAGATTAQAKVQSQYASELAAAKRPEQKAALAKTLLDAGDRSGQDLAQQAALYDESRRLAAEGNDFRLAMQALERRQAKQPTDFLTAAAAIFETVQIPANKRADQVALVELAAKWMERAIEQDQLDAAVRLGTAGQAATRKLSDRDRTKAITDRLGEARTMQAEAAKLGTAVKLRTASPGADAEANLALGRYRCFYKNDWRGGLPFLAAGSDAKLQAAAKKDQEVPTSFSARVAAGDLWWDVGSKLPRENRKNVLRHAAEWYLLAFPELSGAQKNTVQNRIQEAAQTRPQGPPALLPQGLVAFWGFDDASGLLAQDAGGKFHGTLVKASWTQGVRGGGVQFTGADQYVQFPRVGAASTWTLAMWTRIDSASGGGSLFSTFGNQRGHFHLTVRGDGIVDAVIQESAGGSSQATLTPGAWRHVAMRYDSGCALFIDGRKEREFGANKEVSPIIGPGRIGGWYEDTGGRVLMASVDEVRLYGRVLTDAEIAQLAE